MVETERGQFNSKEGNSIYYLQSFSVSMSFNMPRTKVTKSILGRFVPFSLVSLRVNIVYHNQSTICIFYILDLKSLNDFFKFSTSS